MKKRKIKTKIILCILLIIGLIIGIITTNGHYFKKKTDLKDYQNSNWMSYIKDDVKLIDIVIPGSHDAGTCSTNYLGRTQGYDIATQLEMGARYFDLRVNKTKDDYYLYHEYFNGENFIDALNHLTTFINTNKEETLILDFQHFKGESEIDVIKMLEENLVNQDLVIKNNTHLNDLEYISNLTIKDTRGKCIILFGHHEELVEEYDFLFSRNNDSCTKQNQVLNSCYISEYNKMNSIAYIEEGLPVYYQNIKDKIYNEGYKGLFVLQGQLTDGKLIFGPYSKEKTHNKNMSKYIEEIKNDEERLALTNIIMRDFLTTSKCENIITLNYYKNNIKEEFKTEFNNIYYY